ncbi:MAG: ABC transporter ATP-binding protein [Acidobacteria bacterium]|nr:ABC transporter ATP-binding protein [Acidobacteriota bacterium]
MIRVEHLTKQFGDFTAVSDVSFEINEGETFALLGPNGSGKTTMLKCMVGLLLPTAGEITVSGRDIRRNQREAKSLISYLPQRVSFHESLTAREILKFYCELRKIPHSRIDQVLAGSRFNFNGFTDKPVSKFSGGMVQRLGLAVACLPDAPVLILDEPTISLDPEGAIRFREFLATLKRDGKTIVFSSHVLADVEQLADRVAVMVGGKLAALESVEALREGLMNGCRMRVVLEQPCQRWIETVRSAGAETASLEGNSLVITSRPEDRLRILRAIEAGGGHIARFATEEQSLEDIYLKYIAQEAKAGEDHV